MEQIRVLIVDDEEEFASALAERMNLRGIHTEVSCRGEEALSRIDAHPPDVVLLDLMMPGLGGMEIMKRIRAKHPGIAIIFQTGHSIPDILGMEPASGLCDYLIKPAGIDEIIAKVRLCVRPRNNTS
ncbi:MAG: response regulator [Desulfobacteraceae bacterium]|nr:response regulator [Desulfobacteraceae bacterium]